MESFFSSSVGWLQISFTYAAIAAESLDGEASRERQKKQNTGENKEEKNNEKETNEDKSQKQKEENQNKNKQGKRGYILDISMFDTLFGINEETWTRFWNCFLDEEMGEIDFR